MTRKASDFAGLIDLAAEALGGSVLGASDQFFASAQNLIVAREPVFEPGRFTERGKWMDGWESRRKRVKGHDHVIVELGAPGLVYAFDIDTRHFVGNHPPFASVEGTSAPPGTPFDELSRMTFRELSSQVPLRPGSHNFVAAEPGESVSHVRLNIFPDGGVARFRVFGKVLPRWEDPVLDDATRRLVRPGLFDLVALKNGALPLACSDAHFAPMSQLLLPGRAADMGGGWETRRSRAPSHEHDWLLIRLAARGVVRVVEIDTAHYKGNYPERCELEAIDAPGAATTTLVSSGAFSPILGPVPLRADTRHFFSEAALVERVATHLRVKIFPDGGLSRLRAWGERGG